MKDQKQYRLKAWELALLCALSLTLSAAVWAQGSVQRIEDGLIRLHVLAVSDDEEEQRIKLRVRDAVLSFLSPELEAMTDKAEAERIVSEALPQIKAAAESAAEGREVAVTLTREHYPTRRYGSFALPAGEYDSLRVILGEGQGHNWWCVVFPPVCLGAESEEALSDAVGEDTFEILCADGQTSLRFKLLELWGNLTR
ncbi:MAG: stage II sporulation protein R [Eubacteriales bacterium]|nr:stage II sporulation protein R [Eubacteriales bacterium]